MRIQHRTLGLTALIIVAFIFGRSTYFWYLSWFFGSDDLLFTSEISGLLANSLNGLYFSLSVSIIFVALIVLKHLHKRLYISCILQFFINTTLYTIFIAIHRGYSKLYTFSSGIAEISHSHFLVELLVSTLLTIVIMSVIHAKFLSSEHKNGLHKGV